MIAPALRQAFFELMLQAHRTTLLEAVAVENPWFTPGQVDAALQSMRPWFGRRALADVEAKYPPVAQAARVGIIMAGNVPLVGLHDLLAVLITGHRALIKPSHKDKLLMQAFVQGLPGPLRARVEFHEGLRADQVDFLLATGSSNTARQLQHEFQAVPKLIRQNRYSLAVLRGDERAGELEDLAADILLYHGMGCRSVCNVLYPRHFDLQELADALDAAELPDFHPDWAQLIEWEKAIAVMNDQPCVFASRIFMEFRDAPAPARPGVLHLIPCENRAAASLIQPVFSQLQCIVGPGFLPFGSAQQPLLMDFADGVDTFALLRGLA